MNFRLNHSKRNSHLDTIILLLLVAFVTIVGCFPEWQYLEFQHEKYRREKLKIKGLNDTVELEVIAHQQQKGNIYQLHLQTDISTDSRFEEYTVSPDSIKIFAGHVRLNKTVFLWGDSLYLKEGKKSYSNLFVFSAQIDSLKNEISDDSTLAIAICLDGFLLNKELPIKFDSIYAFDNQFLK